MDSFDEGFAFLLAFAIVLPLGLLALVVLVLAGGRDIDPTGRRTFTLYVAAVSFIALFTALIASTAVVSSLAEKIDDDESSEDFVFPEDFPQDGAFPEDRGILDGDGDGDGDDDFFDDSDVSENDRVLQGTVQGALVLVAAGAVLLFHHRRRREYLAESDFEGSAAWRADRAYVYATCFTVVLVFLFATGFGSYNLFKLIAPGVFGSGDDSGIRKDGLQALLTLGWLALASGGIFRYYWLQVHPRAEPAGPTG
jgi:hypothetical protein